MKVPNLAFLALSFSMAALLKAGAPDAEPQPTTDEELISAFASSSSSKNRALQLAEEGLTDELRVYLLTDRKELEVTDWAGDGLLAIAAWHGKVETCAMLMGEPFKMDVNGRNRNDATPLHRASACGDLDCAHLLLEKGAEPGARDKGGKTPIDVAASSEMKELICGLVESTEEYIRMLQAKIEAADREHDATVALQMEADRRVRVAARVQDAVPLLVRGARNDDANGFYDPSGDCYDGWPVYRRRDTAAGADAAASSPAAAASPASSPSSSSSQKSGGGGGTAPGSEPRAALASDIYLFFSTDESAWIVQQVHPSATDRRDNTMFQAMSALHIGHLPFDRQGKRYLKFLCATECFPELRPEGTNFVEDYVFTRRKSVIALAAEDATPQPTSAVEIVTEAEHRAYEEIAALKRAQQSQQL